MNKEGIKSIVLTFLVLFSGFLTWNIWTYSPNIEKINKTEYINNVAISMKNESMATIFIPSQAIYHQEDGHVGTLDNKLINPLIAKLKDWTFYDLKNVSSEITEEKMNSFVHKNGMLEFVFPDNIPFSLYKKILSVEDKELPDFEFNRILVSSKMRNGQDNHIYFQSTTDKTIYRLSIVDSKDIDEFKNKVNQDTKAMIPMLKLNKDIYIPANALTVKSYNYFIDQISSSDFKNALFTEPNNVSKKHTRDGEQYSYSNGRSVMNIDNKRMIMTYENLLYNNVYATTPAEILDRSINYLNDHSGWEKGYRYAETDIEAFKTKFRLYVNDLPVFNEYGISEIEQIWGKNEIIQYQRPIFSIGSIYDSHNIKEVTLDSGKQALEMLKTQMNVELNEIEDMTIGYEMEKKENPKTYIELKPAWFYKMAGEWKQVKSELSGGYPNGLE
ncbi:YycH family regulatory protein [Bacillus testis]|uniref:YycH family regulatory protein n=1 Tax=Bacillus testis TaxID=1622072 RepID=UPI00067E8859|nr:two-component system activity regulator YycH [Bacillus testis]